MPRHSGTTPDGLLYQFSTKDFSGGMNIKNSNTNLLPNEGSEAFNVVFGERGIFKKRDGFVFDDNGDKGLPPVPAGTTFLRYFQYRRSDQTEYQVWVMQDSSFNVWIYDEQGIPSPEWKQVAFNSNAPTKECHFFVYNQTLYSVNSKDGGHKYSISIALDGSGYTQDGVYQSSMPKADLCVIHKNRAFYTLDPINPDYVYYSNLADPTAVDLTINDKVYGGTGTTAGAGGILRVPTNQDVEVTGLVEFQGALVIFKQDSIHTLKGTIPDTDWEIQVLNVASGCVAPKTIVKGNNVVYYLGSDGIYVLYSPFQDQVQTKPVSDRVEGIVFNFLKSDRNLLHANYFKSKYYLFMPSTTPDAPAEPDKPRPIRTLIFDEMVNAWSSFDTDVYQSFVDKVSDTLKMVRYNHVYKFDEDKLYDNYDTGNEGIYSQYTTQYYDLGESYVTKRFRWILLAFRPNLIPTSQVEIRIQIDYKDSFRFLSGYNASFIWGVSKWGEATWGPLMDQKDKLVRFGGSGKFVRFTFTNHVINENLEIHGFTIGYKKRPKVR